MARPDDERPGSGSHWVKSSLSFSNGNCVEVANLSEGGVAVRNSRDPEGPVLRFTPDEWHAFLGGAQLGEFDSFGRLRFQSREQPRTAEGPSRWPGGDPPLPRRRSLPRRRLNRSRAGGRAQRTVPARGIAAAAAPRLARARAVSTVNRRGRYGSPSPRLHPGGSRPAPVAASGRTGRDPLGHVKCPAQPGVRRLAWGSGPVPGPGAYPHRRGPRLVAVDRTCRASQEPVSPAAGYVLALVTGSLERKRHRCKSIARRVAIPFMRFLQLAGRGFADRAPAARGEVRAPGGSLSSSRCSTNTSASCGARHRSAD